MRLINADELIKRSHRVVEYDEAGFSMEYNAVPTEEIKNAPTVDAVPVVRGEWVGIEYDMFFKCSRCGHTTDYMLTNFCSNCGADMRKKVDE